MEKTNGEGVDRCVTYSLGIRPANAPLRAALSPGGSLYTVFFLFIRFLFHCQLIVGI